MNEPRKAAYRYILYQGILTIRGSCGGTTSRPSLFWMLTHWRKASRTLTATYRRANAWHNLAYYSARDFVGFDENRFWKDLENNHRVLDEDVDWYKQLFYRELNKPEQ